MKYLIIIATLSSTVSFAQLTPKGIIEKSNHEIKDLRSVHLNCYFESSYFGQVSSEVFISKAAASPVFGNSRIKMTGVAMTQEGSKAISIAYNGTVFSYLDPEKNEVVVIESPT